MNSPLFLRSGLIALTLLLAIRINVSSSSVIAASGTNTFFTLKDSRANINNKPFYASDNNNYYYCCDLCASIKCKTDVSCYGSSDGQATATGTGGTKPYSYHWSNGQCSNPAINLHAGTYTVTVTDCNSCTSTASVCITQPSMMLSAYILSQTNILCSGGSNGQATVSATGGTLPYQYLWSTSPQQTTATAINLIAGTYTVTVTDAHGCTALAQA